MTEPSPTHLFEQRFTSNVKTVSRQSLVFFLGTLFFAVTGYLFKIYLARTLGAEAIGLYDLGMVMVSLCWMISHFGLPQSAIRYVAIYNQSGESAKLNTLLTNSSALVFISSLVLGGLLYLYRSDVAVFLEAPKLEDLMIYFLPIVPLGALAALYASMLNGFKEVAWRTVITTFIQLPVRIVATIGFIVILGWSVKGLISGHTIAFISSVALLTLIIRKRNRALQWIPVRFSKVELTAVWNDIRPYASVMFLISIFSLLLARVNHVLLSINLDTESVGIFSTVVTTILYVPLLLTSVNSIFAPIIAELHSSGDHKLLGTLFKTITKWISGFTFPLVFTIILYRETFMGFYGSEFLAGTTPLAWMAAAAFIDVSVGSVGYMLLMSGNQRLELINLLFAAIITVGSSL
ncbi:oligosaccharide flippase family protein, partial [Calditrichota bacterium]